MADFPPKAFEQAVREAVFGKPRTLVGLDFGTRDGDRTALVIAVATPEGYRYRDARALAADALNDALLADAQTDATAWSTVPSPSPPLTLADLQRAADELGAIAAERGSWRTEYLGTPTLPEPPEPAFVSPLAYYSADAKRVLWRSLETGLVGKTSDAGPPRYVAEDARGPRAQAAHWATVRERVAALRAAPVERLPLP